MERAAGFAHDDTTQTKLDKLDAVLAQTSTPIQDAALFAEMLSLPNDGRYSKLDLVPEERRQRTQEALTAQLAGLTRQRPVLMIVEDAHWVDPTSLEVFGRTVDQNKDSSGVAHRNLPPRVQRALGWTVACDELSAQPTWRA